MQALNIKYTCDYIKDRIKNDSTTFWGHHDEFNTVKNLLSRTAEFGESNSALLIGPSRSGKTTLVTSVLQSFLYDEAFMKNTLVVKLNGILDTDDRIALKSATSQLKLDNAVDGKVFGSFAENFAFLLACLKSGDKNVSKSVIFILDHFDRFCAHHNQTLLYNLFDIAQSAQAPICVLGLTCRLDVLELFEKRVKSRFSHRQIFLFPGDEKFVDRVVVMKDLLMLPSNSELKTKINNLEYPHKMWRTVKYRKYLDKFDDKWIDRWNKMVLRLFDDPASIASLQAIYDFDVTIQKTKDFFFNLVTHFLSADHLFIQPNDIVQLASKYDSDDKLQLYSDLTVLEICLLIAIKHHIEIYDRDLFNFEMILTRYQKFENATETRMENVDRAIALKSFEHLNLLEIFVPISNSAAKVQKEFQMHKLLLTNGQIVKIINSYSNLPTDISQWAQCSLV